MQSVTITRAQDAPDTLPVGRGAGAPTIGEQGYQLQPAPVFAVRVGRSCVAQERRAVVHLDHHAAGGAPSDKDGQGVIGDGGRPAQPDERQR